MTRPIMSVVPKPRAASELHALVRAVVRPSAARTSDVAAHLDELTKPKGSLGYLEHVAKRLALIYGDPPPPWRERVVYVLAGDHGVAMRGVSAYPREVTAQMCRNYANGGAAISAIAGIVGAAVVAVDIGVDADLTGVEGLAHRKVRRGSRDLSVEPALTRDEAISAVLVGRDLVVRRRLRPDVVALGEMGIGNTTAASALTAALTGASVATVTGRGTGIGTATLRRKSALITKGVGRIPDDADALRVLCEVGGLEIAGLVGVLLGAASIRRAVILDGFIATAAALVAVRLCPRARDYLFASHRSAERGHAVLLETLALRPLLELEMRLGEGTGAALALPILESAAALLRDMATFATAGVATRRAQRTLQ